MQHSRRWQHCWSRWWHGCAAQHSPRPWPLARPNSRPRQSRSNPSLPTQQSKRNPRQSTPKQSQCHQTHPEAGIHGCMDAQCSLRVPPAPPGRRAHDEGHWRAKHTPSNAAAARKRSSWQGLPAANSLRAMRVCGCAISPGLITIPAKLQGTSAITQASSNAVRPNYPACCHERPGIRQSAGRSGRHGASAACVLQSSAVCANKRPASKRCHQACAAVRPTHWRGGCKPSR